MEGAGVHGERGVFAGQLHFVRNRTLKVAHGRTAELKRTSHLDGRRSGSFLKLNEFLTVAVSRTKKRNSIASLDLDGLSRLNGN